MSEIYRFLPGSMPLLLSVPHCGTKIPDHLAARMTPAALVLADTDWHVDKLYDFAGDLGAHLLMANFSRYVVDLNRDPEGTALYPGSENTGIVPLDTFDRLPLYRPREEPDPQEVHRRIGLYWKPYHERIQHELERIKEEIRLCPPLRCPFDPLARAALLPGQAPGLQSGHRGGCQHGGRPGREAFRDLPRGGGLYERA